MHFDLTDLRLFAAVVEEGSISAGASRAGIHHSQLVLAQMERLRGEVHSTGPCPRVWTPLQRCHAILSGGGASMVSPASIATGSTKQTTPAP